MKIVAIKEMSDGNESVGEMWKETKIFDDETKLKDVMKWLGTDRKKKNIILSMPDEDKDEFDLPVR